VWLTDSTARLVPAFASCTLLSVPVIVLHSVLAWLTSWPYARTDSPVIE
jgi:hypothetical protein